jgi:hypothetical protein
MRMVPSSVIRDIERPHHLKPLEYGKDIVVEVESFPARLPTEIAAMGAEYRDLAGKLREMARACGFPGPQRSLLRLAGSLARRVTHCDCRATPEGAP